MQPIMRLVQPAIVSATTDIPSSTNSIKVRSPRTMPIATAIPLLAPNVAERVTTSATLVLGIMASVTIMANSEIESIMLILIKA